MSAEKQYCTFFVNGSLFGLEILQVQEILSHRNLVSVPLAPTVIGGLVNHRGQMVTVIDLRKCLGLSESTLLQTGTMFIACNRDETIGLLVDSISDVFSVNSKDFEPPPQNLYGNAKDLILGAYKLPERLLLPLNLEKISILATQ